MFLAESKLRNLIRSVVYESLLKEESLKPDGFHFKSLLDDCIKANDKKEDVSAVIKKHEQDVPGIVKYSKSIFADQASMKEIQLNYKIKINDFSKIIYELLSYGKDSNASPDTKPDSQQTQIINNLKSIQTSNDIALKNNVNNIVIEFNKSYVNNICYVLEKCAENYSKTWNQGIVNKEKDTFSDMFIEYDTSITFNREKAKQLLAKNQFKKNYPIEIILTNLFDPVGKAKTILNNSFASSSFDQNKDALTIAKFLKKVLDERLAKQTKQKSKPGEMKDSGKTLDKMDRDANERMKPSDTGNVAKIP